MIQSPISSDFGAAVQDFHRLRNQAILKELVGRLTGESNQLLSYDEVRQMLKLQASSHRGLKDIPLDAIVGSVGRYTDFTRDFLPLQDKDADRWARVKVAASGLAGLEPIEVYQVGEVYFVKDGNHRISVARQLGATHIQAYVTEVKSRVALTPDLQPDDLILKAEHADFLEQTQLDQLRPGADLTVTIPGQYAVLLDHIQVHGYFMGLDFQRDIPYEEAVTHWYDTVYCPVVDQVRDLGILRRFPNRTETDLYLWLAEHRAQLEQQLGWQIKTEHAASDLAARFGSDQASLAARIGGKLLQIILPEKLEPGPPAGQWRAMTQAVRPEDRLFMDILVPISGQEESWCALEQALVVAQREQARLYGLYVVSSEAQKDEPQVAEIRDQFNQRCNGAGLSGELFVAAGDIGPHIYQRASVTDLVVVNLAHPPAPKPLARLSSGFRELIQRSPRPILATPQTVTPLSHALLAYDGSPKAREALFVAAYLASKWCIPSRNLFRLTVVSIQDGNRVTGETLDQAQEYLEARHIQATYVLESEPAAEAILQTGETHACDLLILGGYGMSPVLEVVLGSTVDQVLRHSRQPMLICQ